ncbi:MAG TPA: cohesin domain-containing protein [Patescibacteria group bacterium]|nr:cohesin domain-containing protein [Patescibacteria group bacterium]
MKQLRLLIIFLFVFLVGIFTQATFAYAGASLSLSPAEETVNLEANLTLNVLLNTGGVETDAADAIILYDETKLSATSATLGSLYENKISQDTSQSGKIILRATSSAISGFSGSGTLATLIFETIDTGTANVSFQITAGSTTDSNVSADGEDILTTATNGIYTIQSTAIGGTTTASATPSASPSSLPVSGLWEPTAFVFGAGSLLIILALSFFVFL